jgi:phosphohistidine phosphatase SixA
MHLIVLRHATRQKDVSPARDRLFERDAPLEEAGVREVERLAAEELATRELRPALYFTSEYAHARQTSKILRDALGGEPPLMLVALRTLAPDYQGPPEYQNRSEDWTGARLAWSVLHEARECVPDLHRVGTVMFVLHYPRCAQFLRGLTSRAESEFPLDKAEGVLVRDVTLDNLLQRLQQPPPPEPVQGLGIEWISLQQSGTLDGQHKDREGRVWLDTSEPYRKPSGCGATSDRSCWALAIGYCPSPDRAPSAGRCLLCLPGYVRVRMLSRRAPSELPHRSGSQPGSSGHQERRRA